MGYYLRLYLDGDRHTLGGMANSPDHGYADHRTKTDWRIRCGGRCRDLVIWRLRARDSRINHTYNHRRNCGSRFIAPAFGGTLGRCYPNYLGMDTYHTG